MPTGKVKFYDAEKGFGFIRTDDGQDIHLPSSALPAEVNKVRAGTRVEFGLAESRRGPQALSVQFLEKTPSVVKNTRPHAHDMASVVDDLIRLLDHASTELRKGKYPSSHQAQRIAQVMRRVADDFDA
ncbi:MULTISPECIES: cold-shock protein [Auritidibacter]|uniref:Cold shock domain-containing protein n=1 Tax=Auritidibacter ignavus TaxID=678932 RepID=A0AAJ6ALI8_9MICC|nr:MULTISPECIES: cold shock domain-containing protein [Auritidibacter]PXA82526.1 cold-shock protein [Auritidibacter sp. NML120779]AXR74096.1 cold shock domain-containing protein [Auritidibacter sp. NML130574]NIH71890.1 CspA family cold shock protein [Auritidibacter ignavus]PXA76288.1 cold-shock protein [Auritidibacter sp. NML100628]PXA79539.1 cold-shock protein [Auritidibacter sp. NML120636]